MFSSVRRSWSMVRAILWKSRDLWTFDEPAIRGPHIILFFSQFFYSLILIVCPIILYMFAYHSHKLPNEKRFYNSCVHGRSLPAQRGRVAGLQSFVSCIGLRAL